MHVSYTPCFISDKTWPSYIKVISGKAEVRTYYPDMVRTCKVVGSYAFGERDELKAWALSCGHEFEWNDKEPPNYCPNCGAKVVDE